MDNMAYLQQISGATNNLGTQPKKQSGNSILSKIFNIWTILGVIVLTIVITVTVVVSSVMNQVDTKDQELLQESYWLSEALTKDTYNEYYRDLKNSDIRNMTESLMSVLNELMLDEKSLLKTQFGVDISKQSKSKDEIPVKAYADNAKMNAKLKDARLSGFLDRVFLREITMQVAVLRSIHSEIAARTKNAATKSISETATNNLDNLYQQFHNFSSVSI
jgi:hypothetical protein